MVAHANGSAGRALAFGHTFWWSLGLGALALVPALLLPSYVKPQKSLHLKAAGDDPAGRDVSAMLEPQDSVEPVDEGGADRSLLPMANSSVGSLEEGETQ
jgi:hypothetical protein